MNSNNIYVAKLGKAVGLKGQLRLIIDSDFPEQFKKGSVFTTNKKITLTISEYNKDRELVRFEGYDDVDQAKRLTNHELFASVEQTRENCNLAKNEFFWFDLIDCSVIEDGKLLGTVKDLHRYPVSDYLEVITENSLVEKGLPKTFLIPHLFDTYILNVNLDDKTINVKDSFVILENS